MQLQTMPMRTGHICSALVVEVLPMAVIVHCLMLPEAALFALWGCLQ
jgi:hypothetical protein